MRDYTQPAPLTAYEWLEYSACFCFVVGVAAWLVGSLLLLGLGVL